MKKAPLCMQVGDVTGKHFIDDPEQTMVALIEKKAETGFTGIFLHKQAPEGWRFRVKVGALAKSLFLDGAVNSSRSRLAQFRGVQRT